MHVIYQCSEDGAGDTIKPRLNAAGADCRNVAFLDEEMDWLTLGDEKIRRAIADFNAKLLVIDPVQAYLGDADIVQGFDGGRAFVIQLSQTLDELLEHLQQPQYLENQENMEYFSRQLLSSHHAAS